jgi:hypothetical protein
MAMNWQKLRYRESQSTHNRRTKRFASTKHIHWSLKYAPKCQSVKVCLTLWFKELLKLQKLSFLKPLHLKRRENAYENA